MSAALWSVALGLVIATAASRSTLLMLGDRVRLPPRLAEALRYAPACGLAAIIAPELLIGPTAAPGYWYERIEIWAGLTAGLVAYWNRNMLVAILVGMATFWLLRLL